MGRCERPDHRGHNGRIRDVADPGRTREGKSGSTLPSGAGVCGVSTRDCGARENWACVRTYASALLVQYRLHERSVSRYVSAFGKAANVKVDERGGKVKFASCHDLRRSFGERWASRVMPQVLMELMRHESIETTLRFYVGHNATNTARTLYAAVKGDTLGDSATSRRLPLECENAQTDVLQED